jgi:class 3 adenylate cyclase
MGIKDENPMSTAKRKLAAIVFADIAGYTVKTSQDESAALSVRDRVEKLVKASAVSHNGRIVKMMGDGAMLEFASAVEAVSCALEIQDQMDHLNSELDLPEPIALRIGAHVGDVVEEDNDLYGNAVNIASRVHGMAQPGGICITREVYVQIRPILKLQCLPVQGSSSDRLPEKVEVFTVIGEEAPFQSTPRKFRLGWVLGALGVLLAGVLAYPLVTTKSGSSAKDNGITLASSHRLLLPDWVTPGEWFALDAGARSPNLAVYFGNRKAASRFEGGRFLVQTPADLPTEQTTIAVFEGANSDPLMRQQTQVIRYGALAMHSEPNPTDSIGQGGPSVKIDSSEVAPPKVESPPKTGKPTQNRPPEPPEGNQEAPTVSPPASMPRKNRPAGVGAPPLGKSDEYNALVSTIGAEAPVPLHFEFKSLNSLPSSIGRAMHAMTLAQNGKPEDAKKTIQNVRVSLKGSHPEIAVETEAILKTAEALIEGVKATGSRRTSGPHPKFAEAFAYSINRGTRNLPGLLFVEQQIRDNKPAEARRTLELLKKCPELTESEKKALARLDAKVRKIEGAKSSTGTSTEAPKPS